MTKRGCAGRGPLTRGARNRLLTAVLLALGACGASTEPSARTSAQPGSGPDDVITAAPDAAAPSMEATRSTTVERDEPLLARSGPTGAEAGVESQPAKSPNGRGPNGPEVEFIVLNEHELLGSEAKSHQRALASIRSAGYVAQLSDEPGPTRRTGLSDWLDTIDPGVRSTIDLVPLLGAANWVVVVRHAPEQKRIAQGIEALGLLHAEAPHERLWLRIDRDAALGFSGHVASLIALMVTIEGPRGHFVAPPQEQP